MDLVSLYVDQTPAEDLSRERATRFPGMKIYGSIAQALTLGGNKLAVDGVVIVGEHGNYPKTPKGQVQYPRYRFFQETVKVFQASGNSVPVFNDKHLSWNWAWAKEMYDTSRSMGFPLLAGSSLPVTWRIPSLEMPGNARVKEAITVCYGGVDSYDFHGLETLQCMLERRAGRPGLPGCKLIAEKNFGMRQGVWSKRLFDAALCRSHTLTPARAGFNDVFPTIDDMRRLVKDPVAYQYQHVDGPVATMILMSGLLRDFNFAATLDGRSAPLSTQMYLPMPDGRTTLANFFSPLVNNAEQLFLTGKAPYPIERTLLTTGLTAAGVDSLYAGQTKLHTPHLAIRYQPSRESTFWRS
ncbi:MAG: hypothetical protein ACJ746_28940 [Bryobacteraceae bacterium]